MIRRENDRYVVDPGVRYFVSTWFSPKIEVEARDAGDFAPWKGVLVEETKYLRLL